LTSFFRVRTVVLGVREVCLLGPGFFFSEHPSGNFPSYDMACRAFLPPFWAPRFTGTQARRDPKACFKALWKGVFFRHVMTRTRGVLRSALKLGDVSSISRTSFPPVRELRSTDESVIHPAYAAWLCRSFPPGVHALPAPYCLIKTGIPQLRHRLFPVSCRISGAQCHSISLKTFFRHLVDGASKMRSCLSPSPWFLAFRHCFGWLFFSSPAFELPIHAPPFGTFRFWERRFF